MAAGSGVDVVRTVVFDKGATLTKRFEPWIAVSVPSGAKVRVHLTANPGGAYYQSVRRLPHGALLGASGQTTKQDGGQWSTPSMTSDLDASFTRARGLGMSTAVVNLETGRLGSGAISSYDPVSDAKRMILPPYGDALSEYWTDLVATPESGGRMVYTGAVTQGDGEAEDDCAYSDIEVVARADGVIESSSWTTVCPGEGTRRYSNTAKYGPQTIQPATRPKASADSVLNRRIPGAAPAWRSITAAAQLAMANLDPRWSAAEDSRELAVGGWSYAHAVDLDGASVDPETGQPSFSESDGGVPAAGWNPADGWWLRVSAARSVNELNSALSESGNSGAQFITNSSGTFIEQNGPGNWVDVTRNDVGRALLLRARALSGIDALNRAGQPGRVQRATGPDGTSVVTVTPSKGKSSITPSAATTRLLKVVVSVDRTGDLVGYSMYADGIKKGGKYQYDGKTDTRYSMSIRAGVGTVAVVQPEAPSVTHALIAHWLP
jgi:hypothetical protein